MIRILFGVTVPTTAHAFMRPQLTALTQAGWDVHLAADSDAISEELEQVDGLSLHPLPMRRNPSVLKDLISLYRWYKLIQRIKPDIVVGSTPKAAFLSMLTSRWNKVPTRIHHVRGFRAEGLSGIAKRIAVFTEKISSDCATEVLCDSESLKRALERSGCLNGSRGVVLGAGSCCGVDTEYFRPPDLNERNIARQEIGIKNDEIAIGFVGRITRDKGVNELAHAVSMIHESHPEVRLILTGPNEGGIEDLGNLIKHRSVTYKGSTQDVRSAYWALDVFVLPSYREGFPIAPLEAQACALPLITTTATGCVDSQAPCNSSLTVPSKDPDALAQAIEFLYKNPNQRVNMGMSARHWVKENFNSADVIERQNEFLRIQAQRD